MHDPAKREAERERDSARHAERRARPPEPAQPCFKKPRGRAPLAEGKPCSWNGDDGFWTTANGCYHDVAAVRKASKTEHFQRSKRIDKEEQKQRRSLCARIAAAVEASGVPAPSAIWVGSNPTMAFFHRDGAGNWHPFSDAENTLLERAHADGAPRCRLPTMGANPAGHRDFEVRFGANATSARMPAAPDTGMIQVNVENGNTRIVRRDAPAAPDPFGAAIQLTQDFASSSAMYGWMLRKKLSGWRRGAWQRRFYVLAPRSGALLYFTKGLHTREVQLCRSADPAAPQAKGTILLRNAMILPETVEYHCSVCSHAYETTSGANPWWTLARHACPECDALQYPWIDISLPTNQITHPPPAEADDGAAPRDGARPPPRPAAAGRAAAADDGEVLLRADAPRKRGGGGDDASTVSHAQGAALLELFGHARSCPGRHQSAVHLSLIHI